MPFFIRKKDGKLKGEKRKQVSKSVKGSKKLAKNPEKLRDLDENISSEEESSEQELHVSDPSSDEETEQEKKLRLTKKYLQQIENEESEKNLLDTKEAVAQRLKDEALEEAGQLQKQRASEYEGVTPEVHCIFRGHNLSITCLVISASEKHLYTASKDCSIIKWSLEEKKRLKTILGGKKVAKASDYVHTDHVLALAISEDDKFLASGCRSKIINIWNPETMEHIKTFRGHKDAITGLAFQQGSHQLLSASNDRSIKLWNLDEMGYVETLFGHQDAITGIDCFFGETALTAGGRDNTVRIWKIVEESQLVFQAHGASIDCVCVSSHQRFVSGSDDGCLLLWGIHKKKPLSKVTEAHGLDSETEEPNWIVSLCALKNTDLVASGSRDGFIKLWRRDDEKNQLLPVTRVPVDGFVNTLQFSTSGKFLIAGIGYEHRLGRWWRLKNCKNSIVVYSWCNKS
ncbi:LOW QUALITY PROTEIN: U3 small nucleolar RNA-interacting protein 2-like [Uloborus diversus]|uniref:LOW QUALITY PROTEIN: U3 small nucleolar RNA-interacting protein 2-like n=1 Tax=Uloborus diversus TaxID=327109 RepID=UPI00240A3153|nr:LOW QUALITY PROTEIN: U3 small nucleolar RNA-interacting protein 2-like [Uloborus diversus]